MAEQRYGRRAVETGPTGKTVAENLKRLRKVRGLSTRELSGALERAGRSISPTGVGRMEKADRHVTADELVALAAVFNVSPSALLLPLDDSPASTLEVTGAGQVGADVAWDWMDGQRPLRVSEHDAQTQALDYDLYSRPPRRRGTWESMRDLITVTDREAPGGRLVEGLREGDAGGEGLD